MKSFHIQEASFRLPPVWEDQTINIFVYQQKEGRPQSLIVARQKLDKDQTLAGFAETNLKDQADKLPRFQSLGRRTRSIGGLEAIEVRTSWVKDNIAIFQYQVFVLYVDTLIAFTMSAPVEERADCEGTMSEMLTEIRFRKPE